MNTPAQQDKQAPTAATNSNAGRTRSLIAIAAACVVGGAAYAAWWMNSGRYFQETDDAYVAGNVVQITAQVAGTVVGIQADDTQQVKAGQALIQLDGSDARVALDQAEAQLAQAVREVRALYASGSALEAAQRQKETDLARAKDDLARREKLANTGALAAEELAHAKDAVRAADAALQTAREQLGANQAQTKGTRIETHPQVQRAAARVEEAYLAFSRNNVPAPVDGMVARRSVQIGQRIAPGAPLMAVVPLDQVWVDANFKESQLQSMRLGQPVSLHADVYGKAVEYHGHIAGLAAGTGAAFALLPAQNASGNWIKVVQRVPVRIALNPKELAEHPLRVGLSMQVEVDTHDGGDGPLGAAPAAPVASTTVYADQAKAARARIQAIISANSEGRALALPQPETPASAPPAAERPSADLYTPSDAPQRVRT